MLKVLQLCISVQTPYLEKSCFRTCRQKYSQEGMYQSVGFFGRSCSQREGYIQDFNFWLDVTRHTQPCPDLARLGRDEFGWSWRSMATSEIIQNERDQMKSEKTKMSFAHVLHKVSNC